MFGIVMLLFAAVAALGSRSCVRRFERVMLPVSGLVSVFHVVMVVVAQVYIFSSELRLADGSAIV